MTHHTTHGQLHGLTRLGTCAHPTPGAVVQTELAQPPRLQRERLLGRVEARAGISEDTAMTLKKWRPRLLSLHPPACW